MSKIQKTIQSDKTAPVVGRHAAIDLNAYTITVCGRTIVDYEKLEREQPTLYAEIIAQEL